MNCNENVLFTLQAIMANTALPGTDTRPINAAMKEQLKSSDIARLNILIECIKAGLRRINNQRTLSSNPELARLATNYTSLLTLAISLQGSADNAGATDRLFSDLSFLEGQFDKCIHASQKVFANPLPEGQVVAAILSPDVVWQQYFNTFTAMESDLLLMQRQNHRIRYDLRTIEWGSAHFATTLEMAAILNDERKPQDVRNAEVEVKLGKEKAKMEREAYAEALLMIDEGAPAEEVDEQYRRFRTFINNRVGHMRVSAQAITERMQLGYGHAKPVIAGMYNQYIAQPVDEFREHYPVYRQNVNDFTHKYATATRHMSSEMWTQSNNRIHGLAATLHARAEGLRDAIQRSESMDELDQLIIQSEAIHLQEAANALMDEAYVEGLGIARSLTELRQQEQLVSEVLSGQRNDEQSIRDAAGFLGMERDVHILVRQINAYREANGIALKAPLIRAVPEGTGWATRAGADISPDDMARH